MVDYNLVGDKYLLPRKLKQPLLIKANKAMIIVNQSHVEKLQCIQQKPAKIFHIN